jgi:hypothetical protein
MNNELEGMWKESFATYYDGQSWHMLGVAEENNERPQDSRYLN